MTNETLAVETEDKTVIKAGDSYQTAKSASGAVSKHSGDAIATALEGLTLEEVYQLASEALDLPMAELEAKYEHLNGGMQRMNLGNRLRGVVTKIDKNNEKAAKEDGDVGISGDEYIRTLAEPFQLLRAEREEAEAAEKQRIADEKAAAKAEKERIAAEKKAAKKAEEDETDSEEE